MLNKLIAILFLIYMAISSAVFFCIAVCIWLTTILFDKRLVFLHLFTSFWGSMYLWTMPAWSVTTKGREKFRKNQTYVVVSNHQSQLDILIAFRLFCPFKWVSKSEVFKVPFIGWNMGLNGYIKLRRGKRESIKQMLVDSETALSKGCSVYFFPEGTRSKTGLVQKFRPGAFKLAKKLKLPILPIVINGSKDALPKGSLNFHGKSHIQIEVLDEIKYETFTDLPAKAIAEKVREQIVAHVEEERAVED